MSRNIQYKARYIKTQTRHIHLELLGNLTVFNMRKAHFVRVKRLIRYSTEKTLYYNFHYKAFHREERKPVFIYLHGGGWIGGAPEQREAITSHFVAFGYKVFNISYGISPVYNHPRPLENVLKAIEHIIKHKDVYNIDLDNVFIGGESAGAHMTAMVAATYSNPTFRGQFITPDIFDKFKLKGLVLICGVFNMETALNSGYKDIDFYVESYCELPFKQLAADTKREVSPIFNINEYFPPSFLIAGEKDKLRICTDELREKFDELKIEYEYFLGTGRLSVHAFAVAPSLKITRDALAEVKQFMKKHITTTE